MIRDDLSNKLIHFTKGTPEEAANSFFSIISQKKLIGGTGYIKGSFTCICFTESPITKIPYVFSDPEKPAFTVPIADHKEAERVLDLANALDEHDDVSDIYSNFDIPENLMHSQNHEDSRN